MAISAMYTLKYMAGPAHVCDENTHPLKEGADLKIDEENLNHKYTLSCLSLNLVYIGITLL
jgi:hypothetical protein